MTLFKHEPTPRGTGNGENHRGVVRCAVDYAQRAIAGGDAAWEEQISKTVQSCVSKKLYSQGQEGVVK